MKWKLKLHSSVCFILQCSCSLLAQGVEQVSLMLLDEGLDECIQPLPSHDTFDAVLADIHTVVCDSTLQGTIGKR